MHREAVASQLRETARSAVETVVTVLTLAPRLRHRPADPGRGRRARRDRLLGGRHRPGRRGRHRHRGHRGDQADHHGQQHPDPVSSDSWIRALESRRCARDAPPTDAVTRSSERPLGSRAAGHRRTDRRRNDAGLAEFVVCLPVFFLLVIAGIQYALWSHASHLARAAAEQGSQVASGYGSTRAPAPRRPTSFIATTGPGTLTNPQVSTSTLSGDVAQVTVTGRAQALIPWLDLTVSATSNAPIQEYRTSG